ncbi:MAG TPA: D-alanyl-D-alanine carboxypeptidase family protein [Ktedonobacteraceae bacterium]|nr:D-alanyl-D-alanine carboxypeptidase family protein [Ktedonobacteraceae bacterium]
MYKRPPQEEHPQQPQLSYPRRAALRRRQKEFYSDEHPEVPKVRRASLHLDTPAALPTAPRRNVRRKKAIEGEVVPETEPMEAQDVPSTPATNKIMLARRRQPVVYEPPPTAYRRSHLHKRRKQQHAPFGIFRQLTRNRAVAFTTMMIFLFVLVLLPVTFNFLQSYRSSAQGPVIMGLGPTGSGNSSVQPTADPHQIVLAPPNSNHPAPPVFATAAYLIDADTGATLYAHNPFAHLPMLSTTKLMTALLAVEHGNLDQQITITDAISRDLNNLSADSSLMGIKKGETYSLRDLLYGLMLASGNDAAIAIADAIGGNLQTFVTQMNQRAQQLGLYDTHYVNPHGLLDPNHYSCAHDLAILGRVSLGNSIIHEISGTKEYRIAKTAAHAEHDLFNGNQFLWWYPGVDGGKPGFDGDKDFVQVISVTRNQRHLIGVAMHTNDWWTDMRDLMNWGFDNFNWISPAEVDLTSPIPYDNQWGFFVRDKKENTIPTPDHGRYYIFTGYSIADPILTYFDKNNGLKKFGFPEGPPERSLNTIITQQFDHGTIQCDVNARQCRVM